MALLALDLLKRIILGLGKIRGELAVEALGQVLIEDSDPKLRRLAARTLGRLTGDDALSALLAARSDPDVAVREAVESALTSR